MLNNLKKCLAFMFVAAFAISAIAQTTFEKGKLYHIYASGNKGNVVYEMKDKEVGLTDYEKERCELLTGYKLENTWLGKDNDEAEDNVLQKDENGEYVILKKVKATEAE